MKQSLFTINFLRQYEKGMSQADAIRFASREGFAGAELTNAAELQTPDVSAARALSKLCAELKLEIPCLSMSARLETPQWRAETERLKRYLDVAQALGCPMFHHTLAPALGFSAEAYPEYARIKPQLIEAAAEVQAYAARYGIVCVFEDQGFVVNGVSNYGDFFESLPYPNKGVVCDLGNIYFFGETPYPFAARFLSRVAHVHVKDYLYKKGGAQCPGKGWYVNREGDYLRGTIIGHGVTDFVPIFTLLQKSGYDGFYSLEFDGLEDPFEAAVLGKENMTRYFEEAERRTRVMTMPVH